MLPDKAKSLNGTQLLETCLMKMVIYPLICMLQTWFISQNIVIVNVNLLICILREPSLFRWGKVIKCDPITGDLPHGNEYISYNMQAKAGVHISKDRHCHCKYIVIQTMSLECIIRERSLLPWAMLPDKEKSLNMTQSPVTCLMEMAIYPLKWMLQTWLLS